MKIKINARLKPYPFFEVRLVEGHFRSYPAIGFYANRSGFGFVIYLFTVSVQMLRKIKPAPLSEEDEAALRELTEEED